MRKMKKRTLEKRRLSCWDGGLAADEKVVSSNQMTVGFSVLAASSTSQYHSPSIQDDCSGVSPPLSFHDQQSSSAHVDAMAKSAVLVAPRPPGKSPTPSNRAKRRRFQTKDDNVKIYQCLIDQMTRKEASWHCCATWITPTSKKCAERKSLRRRSQNIGLKCQFRAKPILNQFQVGKQRRNKRIMSMSIRIEPDFDFKSPDPQSTDFL